MIFTEKNVYVYIFYWKIVQDASTKPFRWSSGRAKKQMRNVYLLLSPGPNDQVLTQVLSLHEGSDELENV